MSLFGRLRENPVHGAPGEVRGAHLGIPRLRGRRLVARRLPDLLRDLADRWELTLETPVAPPRHSYAVAARCRDSSAAVLRVAPAGPETRCAIEAALLMQGRGAARVLAHDVDEGAVLLERLVPGTPLWALDDDAVAARIGAETACRLWQPLPTGHTFRDLKAVSGSLEAEAPGRTPLPTATVARAQGLLADLLASEGEAVLLHGDLVYGNVLEGAGGHWLAIDPKGIAGERAFEAGPLLLSPIAGCGRAARSAESIDRRTRQLADLWQADPDRLRAWGYVYAVRVACRAARARRGWRWAAAAADLMWSATQVPVSR
jgi:streptomycin 6-kinase